MFHLLHQFDNKPDSDIGKTFYLDEAAKAIIELAKGIGGMDDDAIAIMCRAGSIVFRTK